MAPHYWYTYQATSATTVRFIPIVTYTTNGSTWPTMYWDEEDWRMPQRQPSPPPVIAAPAIIRARAQLIAEVHSEASRRAARALLLSVLDEVQRRDFLEHDWFFVTGRPSGLRYRVRRGRSANIDWLNPDGETVRCRLCVHPADPLMPVEDVMAAQVLHLQHDDAGLRRIANFHPVPGLSLANDRLIERAEAAYAEGRAA